MTKEVTKRQLQIYDALVRVLGRESTPTFKNIAREADCCATYAYVAILSLEKKGLVCREPGKHGSLRLANPE